MNDKRIKWSQYQLAASRTITFYAGYRRNFTTHKKHVDYYDEKYNENKLVLVKKLTFNNRKDFYIRTCLFWHFRWADISFSSYDAVYNSRNWQFTVYSQPWPRPTHSTHCISPALSSLDGVHSELVWVAGQIPTHDWSPISLILNNSHSEYWIISSTMCCHNVN